MANHLSTAFATASGLGLAEPMTLPEAKHVRLVFAALTTMLLLAACYSLGTYSGDGTISRPQQGIYRYRVDLGAVNLAKPGLLERTLSGMPREEFTLGLEVARKERGPENSETNPPLSAKLRLELKNEQGQIVISEKGALNEWVWTARRGGPYDRAFIYRRGSFSETPVGTDGTVRVEQDRTRADGGWGTSFEPRSTGTYKLTVEVVAADSNAAKFEVTLVAYGGAKPSL